MTKEDDLIIKDYLANLPLPELYEAIARNLSLVKFTNLSYQDLQTHCRASENEIHFLKLYDTYTEDQLIRVLKGDIWNISNQEYMNLYLMRNQTPKLVKVAMHEEPYTNFEYIHHKTKEVLDIALEKTPEALKYFNPQTSIEWKIALKYFPYALKHIREQTVEICLYALSINTDEATHTQVRIVPNPNRETTVKNLLAKKETLEELK